MVKNKKAKKQPIFLYALAGVFVLLIVSLTVFNLLNPTLSYNDDRLTHVTSWNTFLSEQAPEDEPFLVYMYLETCGACQEIQQEILSFALDHKDSIPFFLADANAPLLRASANNRPGSATAVPTLVLMENGVVLQEATGITPVRNLLNQLRDN